MAHILVSPLSWGLGHATRDIPLIREFLARGHRVTVLSSGRSLDLLKREVPSCVFLTLADYPTPYTSSPFFIAKFASFIPRMLRAIREEEEAFHRLCGEKAFDLIVSDNRFGIWSPTVPSFIISHQLRFAAPRIFCPFELISQIFNASHHRHFLRVIVPDNPPELCAMSGRLSLSHMPATRERIVFAGLLASVEKIVVPEDIDVLFSISGPEPQRTELEKIVLRQVRNVPGKKIVLLGTPNRSFEERPDADMLIKSHAGREEMTGLMNRARVIVTRSGYTTMMELAELDKKRALLIPTPGQTEQEYLSWYYAKKGWFFSQSQYRLDLRRDLARVVACPGFPPMPKTADNVRRLYEQVFAPCL